MKVNTLFFYHYNFKKRLKRYEKKMAGKKRTYIFIRPLKLK